VTRALVTGATGMLGSYIVERLQDRGWEVRALVRSPDRAGWLRERKVELAPGDLADAASVASAARGTDLVVHAAAYIGSDSEWEPYHEGNVVGTENVLDAARTAGARLVLVSSTAVFGRERFRDEPTHEGVPLPDLPEEDAYGRSKQEAESRVLEAHRAGRAWATVVRPPVMYGERDRQFVPRIAPVFARGFFPLIGGGRAQMTLVHAHAVAEGAVLAGLSDEAGGRVYHLTDDFPVTVADLARLAGRGLDRRILTPSVPVPVARGGFALLQMALTLVGRSDLARHAPGTLSMLTRDNPFTSRRAREELGWSPEIPPEEGLPRAFRWWRERNPGHGDG
jgi:nucleoside-diphosphate-sugar epimerase